jgi:hypothetical protein
MHALQLIAALSHLPDEHHYSGRLWLEYVDIYKYLGVWLDCKLSFQTHNKHLQSKLNYILNSIPISQQSLLHLCCQTYPRKTLYPTDPWLRRYHLQNNICTHCTYIFLLCYWLYVCLSVTLCCCFCCFSYCFALSWPSRSCKWELVLNWPAWLNKGEIKNKNNYVGSFNLITLLQDNSHATQEMLNL